MLTLPPLNPHPAKAADPAKMAALAKAGGSAAVMIERDGNIPPLAQLLGELARARTIAAAPGQAICA